MSSPGDSHHEEQPPAWRDFLEEYKTKRTEYEKESKLVEGLIRDVLKAKNIQGIVTSRAKDIDSLDKKLPDRATKWGDKVKTKEHVEERIHDLAAARINLYFPDDVPIVASEIGGLFDEVHKPVVRTSRIEREDGRGPTGKDKLPPEGYIEGLWQSISKEEAGSQYLWKHYGYRAVHFIVRRRENTKAEVTKMANPDVDTGHLPETKKDIELPGGSEKPDPGTLEPIRTDGHGRQDSKFVKVEIQICTIVMHAWSEVEHDLIYKNKYRLPDNLTMNRMLDSINGLAITSETLLQELEYTLHALRGEADADIGTKANLEAWLTRNYLRAGTPWSKNLHCVGILSEVLGVIPVDKLDGRLLMTFIETQKLEQRARGRPEVLDISFEILIALSNQYPSNCNDLPSPTRMLYEILLVANTISIFLTHLDERVLATVVFKLFSDEQITRLNQISEILTCPGPKHAGQIKDLHQFAQTFLNKQWRDHDGKVKVPSIVPDRHVGKYEVDNAISKAHDMAVALSRLSLFMGFDETWYERLNATPPSIKDEEDEKDFKRLHDRALVVTAFEFRNEKDLEVLRAGDIEDLLCKEVHLLPFEPLEPLNMAARYQSLILPEGCKDGVGWISIRWSEVSVPPLQAPLQGRWMGRHRSIDDIRLRKVNKEDIKKYLDWVEGKIWT